jgi:hypothetical protein
MPVGAMDLAQGEARPLACEPDCDLPRARMRLASLDLRSVVAAGLVRDGSATPRIPGELPWSVEIELPADAPLVLSTSIDLPADRGHAPDIALTVALQASGALVDRVAWAALDGEPLDVAASEAARAALLEALGELALELHVTR